METARGHDQFFCHSSVMDLALTRHSYLMLCGRMQLKEFAVGGAKDFDGVVCRRG
jgi:hypothetical protein